MWGETMKSKARGLEVKHYWSPDIHNPWAWAPENNVVFYLLEMNIGKSSGDAADIYSVIVATPEGILSLRGERGAATLDRSYKILLLDEYSWEKVVHMVNSIVATVDASNEIRISEGLRGYFYWEYQSMK